MLIAATVALLLATVFLVNAVYYFREGSRRRRTWASASGVVAALAERRRGHSPTVFYCPIVEFTTADGSVVRFDSGIGSKPPSHSVGQQVPVMYDRAAPSSARIDAGHDWQLAGPLLVFSIVFSLVGALLLWLRTHPV